MDRINHASAEADKFGAGKDGWTNGDPADPGSGTVPQEEWFDGVQEELVGLIEQAGNTPTDADYGQLADVLLAKVSGHYTADESIAFSGLAETASLIYDAATLTNDRRVLFSFGPASANTRVYWSSAALEITYNVTWLQGTGWVSSGSQESIITLAPASGVVQIGKTLSSNNFTELFTYTGDPDYIPASPSANTLYPATITKALGKFTTDGGGLLTTATGAFNIDSASSFAGSTYTTVYFDNAFANTNYFVQVTGAEESADHFFTASASTTTTCRIRAHDLSTGGYIDPSATVTSFFLEAKGAQ